MGRDLQERETDNCHECCSTDNCNKPLCNHPKPTTCIDDVKVDCAFMNTVANICEDIQHAKSICPRFCDLCTLVDGMWSEWTAWSTCDVTCENGTQTRTRTCTNPPPANGGLNCSGSATDMKACHKQLCPVHGGWTKWSDWETCSVSCDTGIQKRHRNCTNPYPSRFGDHCFGDPVDDRLCMPGPCANGGWSQWGTWNSCSVSCGGGVRSQTRTCKYPSPSLNGKYCDGKNMQIASCNNNSCIPDIVFNAYNVTDTGPDIGQTMIFSNIVVNEGGAYDVSTGEFTAPVDGTYSFSAQLCILNGKHLFFDIKVGGRTYASKFGYNADSYICPLLQTAARVTKHEKVIVQWTTTSYSGYNYIVQGPYLRNFFSGMLIHL
ncbi:coadhesin-like [Mercenaria mercenaria]|uniref:coadhesin-like n=1 Tax=Mercenaria mercenaria TaxID=6596 RepID=UPI00234EE298|nr:coadhesin-like [Mercenaria mercenaria]XP_053378747.1 coadhesin-like [Mercenaria mercenaria]